MGENIGRGKTLGGGKHWEGENIGRGKTLGGGV